MAIAARNIDWLLLGSVLLLTIVGVAFIWSATYWIPSLTGTPAQQLRWAVVGLLAMLVIISFDYMRLADIAYPAYALSLIGLALVPIIGVERNAAKRWIELPGANVQPSELAKIAVILALARYLMYKRNMQRITSLIVPLMIAAIPIGMIVIEPDLGTSMVIFPALFAMLFAAGARPKHLIGLLLAGAAAAPLLWFALGHYQRGRVLAFISPMSDPYGIGWHIRQSLAAVTSGGATGEGILSGSPVLLSRGFAGHTDFIFAVIAHEAGFFGCLAVLFLLFMFFTRVTAIASATREPFGRLVVVGILAMLGFQSLVNIGMTVRLCPITGVTLPYVSYGGSSLLTCFILAAIVISIGMRRKTMIAPEGV